MLVEIIYRPYLCYIIRYLILIQVLSLCCSLVHLFKWPWPASHWMYAFCSCTYSSFFIPRRAAWAGRWQSSNRSEERPDEPSQALLMDDFGAPIFGFLYSLQFKLCHCQLPADDAARPAWLQHLLHRQIVAVHVFKPYCSPSHVTWGDPWKKR